MSTRPTRYAPPRTNIFFLLRVIGVFSDPGFLSGCGCRGTKKEVTYDEVRRHSTGAEAAAAVDVYTGRYATCYKAAEATGLSRGTIEYHLRALRKMGVPVEALRQERAKELPQEPVGAPNTPPPPPGPPTPGEEEAKCVAAIKWATSARGEENPAVVICDGHGSHERVRI